MRPPSAFTHTTTMQPDAIALPTYRCHKRQLELRRTMKTFFRILTCLALLITGALASLPPGTIPQDWIIKGAIAAVLLKGILEGLTIIGDIADDGVRNGSFKPGASHLTRMLTMLSPGPIAFDADFWNKHKPRAGDYLVISGKAFEDGYTLEGPGLNFGQAIEALKKGCRIARKGWNGKGMYLWLLPAATVKAEWCSEEHLKAVAEANGGEIEALGSIRMMTADKKVLTGWLASQTDMLSNDWEILA